MGYRDPVREPGADAGRDLLAAAVALGDHLEVLEGELDDEILARALCAFMDARACYLASLDSRHGIVPESAPPSTHARHSVREVVRQFG
jgi:hypothetical protein